MAGVFYGLRSVWIYNVKVGNLAADSPVSTAADYCRRARRIRASFDRDPFLRHQALGDLARRRNLQLLVNPLTPAIRSPRPVRMTVSQRAAQPGVDATSNTGELKFIEQVAARLQPFGFTFSDRLKLLDSAEQMGIARFRANVILAMHEHQAGRRSNPVEQKPFAPSLLLVLAIEVAVVAGAVWLCTL